MKIAETLIKLKERNRRLLEFLEEFGRDYEHADQSIERFKDFIDKHGLDSFLIPDLVTNLQLTNNLETDFQLEDLAEILKSYIELNPNDLDGYVEYGHFQNAVMDNSSTALQTVEKGIEMANSKLDELRRLKESISKE